MDTLSSVAIGPLRLERLAGPEGIDAIAAEWEALDAELTPRTPFTTPLWNKLWWEHLSARRALVRDEFFVHIVRDAAGQLIAVAPLMLTHRPAIGPLRVRELHFFGADPNLTELRGLICRPQHQDQAIETIAAGLLTEPNRWDWLRWGRLSPDSPVCTSLARSGVIAWTHDLPAYVVDLPPSWPGFRAGLSRNIKESLRKCYNSLKRDGHAYRLNVVNKPEQIAAALECFFALHAGRANAKFSVKHRNVFAAPAARRFIADYASGMAERGQLCVFQLEIGGEVRATRIGFLYGDELYFYYSGYDPAWAKYSIMTTALAEAIRWAIEHGVTRVNLSTGRDVSKTRWRPREILYREAIQIAPNPRARLAFQAFAAVREAGSRGRLGRAAAMLRRRSAWTVLNLGYIEGYAELCDAATQSCGF